MSVCGDRLAGGQTTPQYDGEYKAKGWEERESEASRGVSGKSETAMAAGLEV